MNQNQFSFYNFLFLLNIFYNRKVNRPSFDFTHSCKLEADIHSIGKENIRVCVYTLKAMKESIFCLYTDQLQVIHLVGDY
jgi:hypothetical protein